MSRIFEALKRAQVARSSKLHPNSPTADAVQVPDRRRSRRWAMDICVYVYGHGPGRDTFHEEAHTLNVDANGALLLLSVPVREGQTLLLTNQQTQREMDCRVVRLGKQHSRTVETAVALPRTDTDFWQIFAAPEDDSGA
jgi:hypothetical protein